MPGSTGADRAYDGAGTCRDGTPLPGRRHPGRLLHRFRSSHVTGGGVARMCARARARDAVLMTHRVLIAGSGVAAVEAVLALRHLAGRHFEIELLAPAHALEHRPASVATPFGLGAPPPLDLHELARRYDVTLVEGELAGVDVDRRRARLATGDERDYDHLLVAVGARPEIALPGSLTFRGPADVPMVEWVLAEIARGHRRQLVIVVPAGATWTLPAYELAIMAAAGTRGIAEATVSLVTPEREPLWIFGDAAGEAMRELLSGRGIELHAATRAVHVTDDVLWLERAARDRRRHRHQPSRPGRTGHRGPAVRRRGLPADGRARVRHGRARRAGRR